MAEEKKPEFTAEDLKNLLRAGFSVLRKKGGEVVSKISHEMDPDVKTEKYLMKKYQQLCDAGLDPEHAKNVLMEHVQKLLKK